MTVPPVSDEPQYLDRITLAFSDVRTEEAFRPVYFRQNLQRVRVAYVLGLLFWVLVGLLAQLIIEAEGKAIDAALRFGVAVPMMVLATAFSFTSWFERMWEWITGASLLISAIVLILAWVLVPDPPPSWGFVGLMVLLALYYTIPRIRFVLVSAAGSVVLLLYTAAAILDHVPTPDLVYAISFLGAIVLAGMATSYMLERSSRLLFLERRALAREKERSEALLLNTLPAPIVERLKGEGRRIADAATCVTILFADLVDFTRHAASMTPTAVVDELDLTFRTFDEIAGRYGLEKIKTIGDAYMAAAGVPEPRSDHADAAAEMALGILEALARRSWPTGEPVAARVGIASGPVVAGVIGTAKFSYDLWGSTVNLASRLESSGESGRIHVSTLTRDLLRERYLLEGPNTVDLKGVGPTQTWFLVGRRVVEDAT
jgi:class 3 adenylate cyclase